MLSLGTLLCLVTAGAMPGLRPRPHIITGSPHAALLLPPLAGAGSTVTSSRRPFLTAAQLSLASAMLSSAELWSSSTSEFMSLKRDKHSLALSQLSKEEMRSASQDTRAQPLLWSITAPRKG